MTLPHVPRIIQPMLRQKLHLFSLLGFLLAGCAGTPDNPQVIIIANNETTAPTEIPATPTPEPTPTFPPSDVMRRADRQLLNGYYEDAVATYRVLLTQDSVPDDVRAAAAFSMGQAAVREGLFNDAVTALTDFINTYSSDRRVPQARFLRGDAYLGLSQWAEAIADFEAYLAERPGLIDSYAHERIGDARLALNQLEAALTSYNAAVESSRSLVPLLALRERLAQIYLSNNRVAEAVAQYDAILARAQNAPYRALIELAAARAQLNSAVEADRLAALGRLARVFEQYPETPQAYEAANILTENGRELDDYAYGRVAFFSNDYERAIELFNLATTRTPLGEIPAELYLLLGRAYREIGNSQAALTAFQTIIDSYKTDPAFGEALLEQGRTRFVGGDIPAAIEHYLMIATNYDYLPQAAEAMWRAGFLYASNEQPNEARRIFEQLVDRYPDTPQAIDALRLAATTAYSQNELPATERYYAELGVKATGEEQASAYLWVGRLALQRGDQRTAEQAFQQATQAAPDSYFGARAEDIRSNRAAFAPPSNYVFSFDEAAAIAEAENWLRTTFGITQEGALWMLSPELAADPRLVRGGELWALAAYDEAKVEFTDLLDANETNPLASYQLAIYLRGIGAYRDSIVGAANVIRAANVGTLDAPSFIARMRYPVYYLDVVQEATARHRLDPLLMFSLIRHESLFDTTATAAAGERGLTQVIPSTGEYIAGQLAWPNYRHTDLFRPYAGVAFGAFYLSEQLNLFDGNVTAALGGYNAGPGRSISWIELSGGDHDAYMSAITISSTRTYIQRIYGFYNIYRALYS